MIPYDNHISVGKHNSVLSQLELNYRQMKLLFQASSDKSSHLQSNCELLGICTGVCACVRCVCRSALSLSRPQIKSTNTKLTIRQCLLSAQSEFTQRLISTEMYTRRRPGWWNKKLRLKKDSSNACSLSRKNFSMEEPISEQTCVFRSYSLLYKHGYIPTSVQVPQHTAG